MPTWKKLLKSAQIRNYEAILQMSKTDELPVDFLYHRQCYQKFTNKKYLEALKKQSEKAVIQSEKNKEGLRQLKEQCTSYEYNKPKRSSSSSDSNVLLPDICIFCDVNVKYKNRKPEPLRKCEVKQVKEKLKTCAEDKNDYHILSLIATNDIVAAEAKYHPSCYKDYTRPKKTSKPKDSAIVEYKRIELEAFHLAIEYCYNSITHSKLFKLQDVTTIMAEHLRKHDLTITQSTKKNLRRNLEKSFKDSIKFLSVNNTLFIYSSIMKIEQVIEDLVNEREKIANVAKTAKLIRNEIKELKDEMPWPPQPSDLNPESFNMPKTLGQFLTNLISGQETEAQMNSRCARLRLSIAQDIVYIVTKGRIKTPKSVLLPSSIKQLTNNTEIINTIHRLGHGISYSTLSEMHTENAYSIQDQQLEDVILPLHSQRETFTIYVADNIDRKEETLSGRNLYEFVLFYTLLRLKQLLLLGCWFKISCMYHIMNFMNFSSTCMKLDIYEKYFYFPGYGTTHKVNNIILQGKFGDNNYDSNVSSPKRKRTRRSFIPDSRTAEVNYRYKKREGPPSTSFPENEVSQFILDDSNKRHFLWSLMRHKATEGRIPSWTGFQILISKTVPVLTTSIGYLDCIDASATEMSTIYQVFFINSKPNFREFDFEGILPFNL